MGRAGGEGLVAPLGGVHPQDGDEDVGVGYSYDSHCDHNDGASRKWGTAAGILTSEQEAQPKGKIAEKIED